ncbi:MAG: methylenetetrahydrofolate reductase [NAD(P)H] [Hyphomicrobiales bacterium]
MPHTQNNRTKLGEKGANINVSFEFFPPHSEKQNEALWESVERLAPLDPSFVSVTYGAGGSTRERTHKTVERIVKEANLTAAAHLTCVGASCAEIDEVLDGYAEAGVTEIVALRGDSPEGVGGVYTPHPDGYKLTADLVAAAKRRGNFKVAVSAYPEKHPESADIWADIEYLKRKVDAGADKAITQFFFDNDVFETYLERVRRSGITIPIIPGIAPVLNFNQVANFAERCGTHVPAWLHRRFEGLENDPGTRRLVAAAVATEQVLDLVDRGISDFHFYTMNRANLVYAICHMLGVRGSQDSQKAA